jgi:phage shock protein E
MFFTHNGFKNISPDELNEKLKSDRNFLLLDVRTAHENAAQAIEHSCLIPVQELAGRVHELPKDREIVVYCRVGSRSSFASAYLAQLGYNVVNLEGGIVAWNMSGHAAEAADRSYYR